MGWWVPRAALTPDEDVLFEAAANMYEGSRAIGGKVTVTPRRLLFTPNRVDLATGAQAMAVDRGQILGTEVVPGRDSPIRFLGMASPRRLVGVDHAGGRTYFLINKRDQFTAALRGLA